MHAPGEELGIQSTVVWIGATGYAIHRVISYFQAVPVKIVPDFGNLRGRGMSGTSRTYMLTAVRLQMHMYGIPSLEFGLATQDIRLK